MLFRSPLVSQPTEEAQPQHPPSSSQYEQDREQETLKGSSSDKVTEASQPGVASQDFEKQLALVTLPVEGALQEKEKEIPPGAVDKAPKSNLKIKLKP